MLVFGTLTVVAVAALLVAEHRDSRLGVAVAKPLASLGFVGAALASGALESAYGRLVLAALVLSLLGDVLLVPRERPRIFRAGVLSFLLAHLAFAVAFLVRRPDPGVVALAALVAAAPVAGVWRWLGPRVGRELRGSVIAYTLVISLMVVCAAGAAASSGDARILVGAIMFYASDLSVARDRFVASTFANRAWGLPLYFTAQLVLASTVA